jgi:hypothetical protein
MAASVGADTAALRAAVRHRAAPLLPLACGISFAAALRRWRDTVHRVKILICGSICIGFERFEIAMEWVTPALAKF